MYRLQGDDATDVAGELGIIVKDGLNPLPAPKPKSESSGLDMRLVLVLLMLERLL